MKISEVVFVLFTCTLLFYYDGVQGRNWKLSKGDLDIEEQLKLLNKQAVKTIRTVDGDNYDCVDFYKQPAFDHPSLQNYTFELDQMKFTRVINKKRKNIFSNANLKEGQCPIGTVPIRRITKDDLIREKLATNFTSLFAGQNPDAHYAVVRTKAGTNRYSGAGGLVTIYKPLVNDSQYSASRFLLRNGPDSIEVGWRVDPVLYGDTQSRLFIRTTINNQVFFGVKDSGFILTTDKGIVDRVLTPSQRDVLIKQFKSTITTDASGNWLLFAGDEDIQVGYWPKNIFTSEGLTQLASYVEWGGEVYSPAGTPKPPMGSSFFPEENSQLDCLYNFLTVANENGGVVNATDLETFADSPNYKVIDEGNQGGVIGYLVVFGGPGGQTTM